jgi:hypothetical protein
MEWCNPSVGWVAIAGISPGLIKKWPQLIGARASFHKPMIILRRMDEGVGGWGHSTRLVGQLRTLGLVPRHTKRTWHTTDQNAPTRKPGLQAIIGQVLSRFKLAQHSRNQVPATSPTQGWVINPYVAPVLGLSLRPL